MAHGRYTQYLTLGIDSELSRSPVEQCARDPRHAADFAAAACAGLSCSGIIDVRGAGYPILDLRTKFGLPRGRARPTARASSWLDAVDRRANARGVGLVADCVFEVTDLDGDALEPPPAIGGRWRADYIVGIGRKGDGLRHRPRSRPPDGIGATRRSNALGADASRPDADASRMAAYRQTRSSCSERHFAKLIAGLIESTSGIQPAARQADDGRGPAAQARARARPRRGSTTMARRSSTAASSNDEFVHLIDCVTTNKTDFFREPEPFRVPARRRRAGAAEAAARAAGAPLKIWSAACSTGAEAYTLAMVLAELLGLGRASASAILATDISTDVLHRRSAAIYPKAMIEPVPAELRRRYLLSPRDRGRGGVRIVPELRRVVRFARLNLMDARLSGRSRLRRDLLPQRPDLFRQADPGRGAASGCARICGPAAICSSATRNRWPAATCRCSQVAPTVFAARPEEDSMTTTAKIRVLIVDDSALGAADPVARSSTPIPDIEVMGDGRRSVRRGAADPGRSSRRHHAGRRDAAHGRHHLPAQAHGAAADPGGHVLVADRGRARRP